VNRESVARVSDMGTMALPSKLVFEGREDDRFTPRLSPAPRLPRELIGNPNIESRLTALVATQPLVWIRAGSGMGKRTAVVAWLQQRADDLISGWLKLPDTAAQNREALPLIFTAAVAASTGRTSMLTPFRVTETLAHQRAWAIDLVREQKKMTVLVVDIKNQWLSADEMAAVTLFAADCLFLSIVLIQDDNPRAALIRDAAVSDIDARDLRLSSDALRGELAHRDLSVSEAVVEKILNQFGGSPFFVSVFVEHALSLPSQNTGESLGWAHAKALFGTGLLLMPEEGLTVLTLLALIPEMQESHLATTGEGRRVDLELRNLWERGLLDRSSTPEDEYVYSLPCHVREIMRSMTLAHYLANRTTLHQLACGYFVAIGKLDSAVRQLQLLGDSPAALNLFATHWRTFLRLRGHRAARELCTEFSPTDVLMNLEASAAMWLLNQDSPDETESGTYGTRILAADSAQIAVLGPRGRLTFRTALILNLVAGDQIELAEAVMTAASSDIDLVLTEPGVATRELYLEHLITAGTVALANGALRQSAQLFQEALASSETMNDPDSTYRALSGLALSLTANGEISAGQSLVERAIQLGEKLGMSSSPTAVELVWCQSLIWTHRDDFFELGDAVAAARNHSESNSAWESISHFLEAKLLVRNGENLAAASILQSLLASIIPSPTLPLFRQSVVCLLGTILVASHQPGAALELLSGEPSNVDHMPCVESTRGLAYIAKRDPRAAIAATDHCLEHTQQHAGLSLIRVYLTRALAFEAMNLPTSAEDAFATALGIAANSDMRLNVQMFAGTQLVDVHRRTRAKKPTFDSEALMTGRVGAVPPHQGLPTVTELTRKEREVLQNLIFPLPIVEIAAKLFISKNTLKTHIRNIYSKLGATTRAEAVDIAITWGDTVAQPTNESGADQRQFSQ